MVAAAIRDGHDGSDEGGGGIHCPTFPFDFLEYRYMTKNNLQQPKNCSTTQYVM